MSRGIGSELHPNVFVFAGVISKSFLEIDETDRIQDLTSMLNIDVEKIFPMEEEVIDVFKNVIYAMEMPFKSSTPLVQYLLMHRCKKMGVSVVLNGHGSDEMLGGYPYRHCPLVAADHFINFRLQNWNKEMKIMKNSLNLGYKEFIYALIFNFYPKFGEGIRNIFRKSKIEYFQKYGFKKYQTEFSRSFDKKTGGKTILDRRLRREYFGEVLPVWLNMEDRVSMSASVESRLPFMDYRLVEFVFGINDDLKIRNGITKRILRNSMKNKLPESIVSEKNKFYFSGPQLYWLKKPLRALLDTTLLDKEPLISEYIKPDKIKEIVTRVLDHNEKDQWDEQFVWRMFMTEAWMQKFFN